MFTSPRSIFKSINKSLSMESLELAKDVCRICLELRENINWNNKMKDLCGISYKDCYYKYTQLVEPDPDCFPTYLCERCANELKSAHLLFEMAVESLNILKSTFNTKELKAENSPPITSSSTQQIICESFDESIFTDEKTLLEIDDVVCYSPAYDAGVVENQFNEVVCNETSESFFSTPLGQQTLNNFNIKLLKTSVDEGGINKMANLDTYETTLELNLQLEIQGSKFLKPTNVHRKSLKKQCKEVNRIKKAMPRRTVICNRRINKTLKSNQNSLSQKNPNNGTASLKFLATSSFEEERYEPSHQSQLEFNFEEECKKTNAPSNIKRFKPKEFQKSPAARNSLKIEKFSQNDTNSVESLEPRDLQVNFVSDTEKDEKSMLEEIFGKGADIDSLARRKSNTKISLEKKHLKSIYLQECPVSDTEKDEKSMLEEIFGKDFDINNLGKSKSNTPPNGSLCQYCSLKMKDSRHLKSHESIHLKNRQRKIICPKCGIKLYTKEALNSHMKIHDENRQKKHKCEYCDKAFFHSGALNVHRRIHLGLMIKCPLCPKEFYRQFDLDKHLPSHSATHLQSKDINEKKKKYKIQCNFCNKAVLTPKWKAHKAKHLNQPAVKCKICDKDFFSRHSCARHIKKTHHKERHELEENMHYYVDCSGRLSHLMMKQQESLMPLQE